MPLFLDDRDRTHRLDLLAELPERFGAVIHAFALMDNHDHCLLQMPLANLGAAMQWLNMSYGVWFNRRHKRLGPIFSGPYKAILVEEDGAWALELSRYIHLNPIRTLPMGLYKKTRAQEKRGGVAPPSPEQVAQRLQRLREYRWSSYGAYAGYRPVPDWLTTPVLLQRAGGLHAPSPGAYRKYVENYVRQHVEENFWDRLQAELLLGSRQFLERTRPSVSGNRREQPALRKWDRPLSFEAVVAAVERAKGEPWKDFHGRHGDWGRDLVLYLARHHCGMTLGEIGAKAGGLDYAAVSTAIRRFARRLGSAPALQASLEEARRNLSHV